MSIRVIGSMIFSIVFEDEEEVRNRNFKDSNYNDFFVVLDAIRTRDFLKGNKAP